MSEPNRKDRLPPGQYLTRSFPVSHVGSVPTFDPAHWELRFYGLVGFPLTLSHADFLSLPRVARTSDMHCVSTWSRYDLAFEGVPFRELAARLRPLPDARHVLVHADGGYTTSLTLEALLDEDVLIADRLGGEPLSPEHGYPARLVVPKLYSWKSAKWVRGFEFLDEEKPGFWEMRGYSATADPFTEDRFAEV